MSETISRIWEELIFYGPAFASIFAVLALGILALLLLIIFKYMRGASKKEIIDVDKNIEE